MSALCLQLWITSVCTLLQRHFQILKATASHQIKRAASLSVEQRVLDVPCTKNQGIEELWILKNPLAISRTFCKEPSFAALSLCQSCWRLRPNGSGLSKRGKRSLCRWWRTGTFSQGCGEQRLRPEGCKDCPVALVYQAVLVICSLRSQSVEVLGGQCLDICFTHASPRCPCQDRHVHFSPFFFTSLPSSAELHHAYL